MLQTKILPKAKQMLTKPNYNYENFMKRNYLIGIIVIAFLLNACSSWNLQKRRYTKGYYLSIRGSHTQIKENPAPNNSQPLAQVNSPQFKAPLSNIKPLQNTWSAHNELDLKPNNTKIQVKKHNTHKPSQQGFINPLHPLKTKLFRQEVYKVEGKGAEISKIIGLTLLSIFLFLIGLGIAYLFGIFDDSAFTLIFIPNLLLFIWNCYRIAKRIKALSASNQNTPKSNTKNATSGIIKGYSILQGISLSVACIWLINIINNYIFYITMFQQMPGFMNFRPKITPSYGLEPFLLIFLGLALLAGWLGTGRYTFKNEEAKKSIRKKTFIISTLLFLSGLFYLALAAANLLSFTALPFYAPMQSPLYLLIIGIASIITSLLPSKILFGKSIPEFFKSKF